MARIPLLLAGLCLGMSLSAVAADTPPASAPSDDDKIVCKRYQETGSRVRRKEICKTRAEWRAEQEGAKEFMKDVERRGSTQPGGEDGVT